MTLSSPCSLKKFSRPSSSPKYFLIWSSSSMAMICSNMASALPSFACANVGAALAVGDPADDPVGEAQDPHHAVELDLLDRVRRAVVVLVESREKPDDGDLFS